MSAGRSFGFGLLGAVVGLATGAALGLVGGLGYVEMAATSGFEGRSGFVVGYWMLGGLTIGLIAGVPIAIKLSRKSKLKTGHQ